MLPFFTLFKFFAFTLLTVLAYFFLSFVLLPVLNINSYKRKGFSTFFFPILGYLRYWDLGLKSHEDAFMNFKTSSQDFPNKKVLITNLGNKTLFLLRDPTYIKDFLHSQHKYHKVGIVNNMKPLLGNGLATAEGSFWRNHRRIISNSFHYELLKSHVPIIQETTKEFLDKIKPEEYGNFKIIDKVQEITGEVVGRVFFGNNLSNYQLDGMPLTLYLARLMTEIMKTALSPMAMLLGTKSLVLIPSHRRVMEKTNYFREYCQKIIADRRKEHYEANDLLNSLLQTQKSEEPDQRLTDSEIIDEFISFFVAGMDTTGHLISMTLLNIIKYPRYQKILQQERDETYNKAVTAENLTKMDELHCLIKETLRMYHPAPVTFDREALEDHKLGDLDVPKGTWVKQDFFAVSHNEKYWDEPFKFKPERFKADAKKVDPYAFVPFGGGPRNCIGQHLSIIETKIIISEFLERFHCKLIEGYELKMAFKFLYEPLNELTFDISPKHQQTILA